MCYLIKERNARAKHYLFSIDGIEKDLVLLFIAKRPLEWVFNFWQTMQPDGVRTIRKS